MEVNPGGFRGQTTANGIAKVTINTPGGSSTLQITVRPANSTNVQSLSLKNWWKIDQLTYVEQAMEYILYSTSENSVFVLFRQRPKIHN